MANLDAAFGLRPYKMLGNISNNVPLTRFAIQTAATAGTASVIYEGEPVIPLANGMIDVPGAAAGGTVAFLGVFTGCNYIDLNGKPTWSNKWPGTAAVKASTPAYAMVAAHPDQLYLINCDAAAADTAIHATANFATITSGNATTGISTGELAVSTVAQTGTLAMRIIGFEDTPGSNDATVAGRLAIVMLNNHVHRYCANNLGVGV